MPTEQLSVAVNPHPGRGELTVLFSGQERTKPGHNIGPQVRDYYLVHHVLSGKGTFQCMGRTYELGQGDSFFIFPGDLIRYTADDLDPWTYRWVGFRGDGLEELLGKLDITSYRPVARPARHRRASALYHQIERTLAIHERGCELRSEGLMRLLLAEYAGGESAQSDGASNRKSPMEQQVERTIRWLSVQYAQPISIEKMSQSLGYNRTHLSKMFKQYTGMTPIQFLLKIRMERAKLLLRESLTVEQVASSVGFSDPLYFSKQFKKWFGQTPTDYKQDSEGKPMYDCCSD